MDVIVPRMPSRSSRAGGAVWGGGTSRMAAGQRRAGRAEHRACAGDGHFQLYLGVCHAGAAVCQDLQLIFVSFRTCAVKTVRQSWEDKGSWGSGHKANGGRTGR